MALRYFLVTIISLFSVSVLYPMNLFKKDKIKLFKRSLQKNSKRNIVITTSCLVNKQSNNKVLLLGDMHEAPGMNDKHTFPHTQQMISLISTLKNRKNNSLFLEFSNSTRRLLDIYEQQHGTRNMNVFSNIVNYLEKESLPYCNFDTRDDVDTQMPGFVNLRTFYTNRLLNGQEFHPIVNDALFTPLAIYLARLKEKQARTMLNIDNSNIPQSQKIEFIKQGYEAAGTIMQAIETVVASYTLPEDTPLINIINILGELYPQFPLHLFIKEGSYHIDINLLTKILQRQSHLAVALCGFFHTERVKEYLKLTGYDIVEEQKNGLNINLQDLTINKDNTIPSQFLTESIKSFIA